MNSENGLNDNSYMLMVVLLKDITRKFHNHRTDQYYSLSYKICLLEISLKCFLNCILLTHSAEVLMKSKYIIPSTVLLQILYH